jgi:hypothetical protein
VAAGLLKQLCQSMGRMTRRGLGDMVVGPDARLEKGGSISSDSLHTLVNSNGQGEGNQNNVEHVISKTKEQHCVLGMIRIVDPEFRKQIWRNSAENNEQYFDAKTEEARGMMIQMMIG